MEGARFALEKLEEGLGEDVLARVLLHVIEAQGRVDPAAHRSLPDRRAQDVEDPAVELDDLEDLDAVEGPAVPGLAARFRIEGRPIEHDGGLAPVLHPGHHGRLELEKIRVVVIEPACFRHRCLLRTGPGLPIMRPPQTSLATPAAARTRTVVLKWVLATLSRISGPLARTSFTAAASTWSEAPLGRSTPMSLER
jgi:hypothetical protein